MLKVEKTSEDTWTKTELKKTFGIALDVSKVQIFKEALRFKDEASYDIFSNSLKKNNPEVEVALRHPDGSIEETTFEELKKRLFN